MRERRRAAAYLMGPSTGRSLDPHAPPTTRFTYEDLNIYKDLSLNDKEDIAEVINKYSDLFSDFDARKVIADPRKRELFSKIIHVNDGATPVRTRYYRPSFVKRQALADELLKMHRKGIIERSQSAWSSPAMVVPKPSGGWRVVNDYRKVNEHVTGDVTPLPSVEDALSQMDGMKYFTAVDAASGFHQCPLPNEEDRELTAFSTHTGHWQYTVLPMGLKMATSVFQRYMNTVLSGLSISHSNRALTYVDDIIIMGKDLQDHLQSLDEVLAQLHDWDIKLN